ncbi:hypothetical protein H5410_004600 [Solanum commersonii]|uniref:Uncharacterized protein n=1 Tax=Solanum commersonii TaxID=4109 RepID=A0A9J6B8F9_SOLCO|nr:hypothetical protein H5410_004600 [Solanum commersonii]
MEDDIFSCDDNPVNTENVYQPMSVNNDNDNGSGKWTTNTSSGREIKREGAKEKEKREREQAQSSTHNEIDIYSEQVVIIQLQNLMTKHNIDKR